MNHRRLPGGHFLQGKAPGEFTRLEDAAFGDERALAVHHAIMGAGGPGPTLTDQAWIDAVLEHCADDSVRAQVRALTVEPLPSVSEFQI